MPKSKISTQRSTVLPNIGAPATRALEAAKITTLAHVAAWSESELSKLHGVGPKAVRILREALADAGMSFASASKPAAVATHPLVLQLRFSRREFLRSVIGVTEPDAQKRILPMNCLSWNVGHLAWQEQRYFLHFAQQTMPLPEIDTQFAFGCPASTPQLKDMLAAWRTITRAADPWLDFVTTQILQTRVIHNGKPTARMFGNLLQRTIYHYWYHTGENMAIRQMLGHAKLGVFVGNIDDEAPYRPE